MYLRNKSIVAKARVYTNSEARSRDSAVPPAEMHAGSVRSRAGLLLFVPEGRPKIAHGLRGCVKTLASAGVPEKL
jgi:hypothetical protein